MTSQGLEVVAIEVWTKEGCIKVINFYNPCRQLNKEEMEGILDDWSGKIVWCGDFNAHSTMWGDQDDSNGEVVEEVLDDKGLVCLNTGIGTRVNLAKGTES